MLLCFLSLFRWTAVIDKKNYFARANILKDRSIKSLFLVRPCLLRYATAVELSERIWMWDSFSMSLVAWRALRTAYSSLKFEDSFLYRPPTGPGRIGLLHALPTQRGWHRLSGFFALPIVRLSLFIHHWRETNMFSDCWNSWSRLEFERSQTRSISNCRGCEWIWAQGSTGIAAVRRPCRDIAFLTEVLGWERTGSIVWVITSIFSWGRKHFWALESIMIPRNFWTGPGPGKIFLNLSSTIASSGCLRFWKVGPGLAEANLLSTGSRPGAGWKSPFPLWCVLPFLPLFW